MYHLNQQVERTPCRWYRAQCYLLWRCPGATLCCRRPHHRRRGGYLGIVQPNRQQVDDARCSDAGDDCSRLGSCGRATVLHQRQFQRPDRAGHALPQCADLSAVRAVTPSRKEDLSQATPSRPKSGRLLFCVIPTVTEYYALPLPSGMKLVTADQQIRRAKEVDTIW